MSASAGSELDVVFGVIYTRGISCVVVFRVAESVGSLLTRRLLTDTFASSVSDV